MADFGRNSEIPVKEEWDMEHGKEHGGPDIVGYLKYKVSEIISSGNQSSNPVIQKTENAVLPDSISRDQIEEIERINVKLDKSEGDSLNESTQGNSCNSGGVKSLFEGGVVEGLAETQKERLRKFLKDAVLVMNKEVDEMTEHVIQVSRMRTSLKKRRSRAVLSSKCEDTEKVNSANKKQKMLFLARSEAAHRKCMMDLLRQFGSILKQIMQHKWSWPFTRPVDVAGLGLRNYYDVIKRPMDLGSIRDRLEAKDGSGYTNVREICEDVRLVFRNAMMYNQPGTDVHRMAKALLEKFEEKWRIILEPKIIELEAKREDQGCLDISGLDSEAAVQKYSDEVLEKLDTIEQQLEDFLGAATSNCRPMSAMEKKELLHSIHKLPASSLHRIIEIIAQKNPSFDVSAEELPVDLDREHPETLWRLYFYVQAVANASHHVDED